MIELKMIQAQGYAAQQAKSPLHQYSFERRDPRNHDVVVDIQYCGICHTDVHQVNDEWGDSIFPMVPGHEIVGIVTKVGANVSRYKLGDRVGVGCLVDSCRKCSPCKNGLEQYCIEGPTMTYNGIERDGRTRTQGGYSNKIVVDETMFFIYLIIFQWIVQHHFSAPVLPCILLFYIGMQVLGRELA